MTRAELSVLPVTGALNRQKEDSLPPEFRWLMDCMDTGTVLGSGRLHGLSGIDDPWPFGGRVKMINLRRACEAHLSETRKGQATPREIEAAIHTLADPGKKLATERIRIDGQQHRVTCIPDLPDCYLALEAVLNMGRRWTNPSDDSCLR